MRAVSGPTFDLATFMRHHPKIKARRYNAASVAGMADTKLFLLCI
jgi:hypothetical protein